MGTVKCADCAYLMRTALTITSECNPVNYPFMSEIEAFKEAQAEEENSQSSNRHLLVDFCGAIWLKLPRHAVTRSGTMVDSQIKRKCQGFQEKSKRP